MAFAYDDDIPAEDEPKPRGKKRKELTDEEKEELCTQAREDYERCVDVEDHNHKEYIDDVKFARLAEQWPKVVREARGDRPMLTINRLPAIIRQVVNDQRLNKPQIKVRPVDSKADVATAEVFSGLIRNIEYSSNADVAYDTATDNAVTGGFGYFRINLGYAHEDTFDLDILIDRVPDPLLVHGDPDSRAADSSDWNMAFVTEKLTKKQFEKRYAGKEAVDWDSYTAIKDANWYDDDGVLVAEYWTREEYDKPIFLMSDGSVYDQERLDGIIDQTTGLTFGASLQLQGISIKDERTTTCWRVLQRLLTGADVLEDLVWPGQYIPIVPVYGDEVILEGKRFFRSLIRDAKDPQRMLNYWRTASTELVAMAPKAPWVGPRGFARSDKKWSSANVGNPAYLEYDLIENAQQQAPQRQPFTGPPAGALQEALNAQDDLKSVTGIFDAGLGAQGNETSGKAITNRQREGDVGTFHFQDNMSRAIRHAGRILIDLIPRVYKQDRIVRILGEDGTPDHKPLGQPVPVLDKQGQPVMQPAMGPDGMPLPPGPDGQPPMEPKTRIFDLTIGKYDLTVTTGPSFTTRREEAANQMIMMIQANPALGPLIGDLVAKNLDWQGAEEIGDRLKAMLPPQVTGGMPPEVDRMIKDGQALIETLSKENAALKADKEIDAAKLKVDAFDAETRRMKVMADEQAAGNAAVLGSQPQGIAPEQLAKMQEATAKLELESRRLASEREQADRKLDIEFYGKVTDRLKLGYDVQAAQQAALAPPPVTGNETPALPPQPAPTNGMRPPTPPVSVDPKIGIHTAILPPQ